MTQTPEQVQAGIDGAHATISRLREEIGSVVVGQRKLVDRILQSLLVRGHLLIEGVPGLAKTLAVKTVARTIEGSFRRVQFTPDLLPADITGTLVFDPKSGAFHPRFGPVFANFVLADEINRAPAKVQSALLEAMQERQVTIGEISHRLPEPFVVVATQNPIEQEGTYTLPEAQVDRFLMKVRIDYPQKDEEVSMLGRFLDPIGEAVEVRNVTSIAAMLEVSKLVAAVHLDARIRSYIVEIVRATREPETAGARHLKKLIALGASPRATLAMAYVAKAEALFEGRAYVTPDDVKRVAHDVLRHRVIPSYEAAVEEKTADQMISEILSSIRVP
jgi:MoxR-like ATPase